MEGLQGIEDAWMEADSIQIKTLMISLASVIAVEIIARAGIRARGYNPMVVLGAIRLVQTGLIIIIVLIREKKGLASIGLSPAGTLPGLKRGLIWSAGFGLITLLGFVLIFAIGRSPLTLIHTHLPAKPGDIVIYFLAGGLTGPIAEEVIFRGIVYGFLRRWGAPAAILLSTLVFVLAHPDSPVIPITRIAGGILFAMAYEIEKNLVVPVTIHALGNAAIFTLSLTVR